MAPNIAKMAPKMHWGFHRAPPQDRSWNGPASRNRFGALLGPFFVDFGCSWSPFGRFSMLLAFILKTFWLDDGAEFARICQNLPGSARYLPRTSWSTTASTHRPHTYTRPVMPTRSQTARTQNRGAAVTGLWPPSIESAAPGLSQEACEISVS